MEKKSVQEAAKPQPRWNLHAMFRQHYFQCSRTIRQSLLPPMCVLQTWKMNLQKCRLSIALSKVKRTLNEFGEGIGPYNSNLPASDSESSKHTNGKHINPVSIKSKDCWSEGSIME